MLDIKHVTLSYQTNIGGAQYMEEALNTAIHVINFVKSN